MIRFPILIACLLLWMKKPAAQPVDGPLTLDTVIARAQSHSIPAIRARHQYLAAYWQYRAFRANYLPALSLQTVPINLNRTVTQRFDVNQNVDVYLLQRNVQSHISAGLHQRIGLTGGSVFVASDWGRLQNFGNNRFTNYSVAPLRIGWEQPIFAFNEWRSEKEREPLAYELAKKNYVAALAGIASQAVQLFFDLAAAQQNHRLALENVATADTLLGIGRQRSELGTFSRDDLLELELRMLQAQAERDRTALEWQKARASLLLFTGLPADPDPLLILPQGLPVAAVEPTFAFSLARQYHPEMLRAQYDELVARQDADRVRQQNRFQASVSASVGLNQSDESLAGALGNLLDQEQLRISLDIPLLDWGNRQGRARMAASQREVVYAITRQARLDFEQEVRLQAASFAFQAGWVAQAARARTLAQERYRITRQRYLLGHVDLLKLTAAIQASNAAGQQYIQALSAYWTGYFSLRELTLYDFETGQPLEGELIEP